MTTKQKFLQSLKAKIKIYQDAYDYNVGLPDDIFESLNGHHADVVSAIAKKGTVVLSNEYGANIAAVREIISSTGTEGISKSGILNQFPGEDDDKKYTIVTNALSSLNKGTEIEKFKPKGKRMRGYYWRMKA